MKKKALTLAILCLFVFMGGIYASDASENININSVEINSSSLLTTELNDDSNTSDLNNSNSTSSNDSNISNTIQSTNQTTINNSNESNISNTIQSTNQTTINNSSESNSTSISSNSNVSNNNSSNILAAGDSPTKVTQSQILTAASSLYKYIVANKKLPNYVTIGSYNFSMPEFLYLMSKVIVYKYTNSASSVTVIYDIANPSNPTGSTINGVISSKYYYAYAKSIANYISTYNKAPNYVSTAWGKMQYQTTIFAFAKLLSWSNTNSRLPNTVTVQVSKSNSINTYIPKYTSSNSTSSNSSTSSSNSTSSSSESIPSSVLNSVYTGFSLTNYLKASTNCQVSNSAITSLAASLTKNCTTDLQKATAIFNYVRDSISYSFYYNTKYGATGTLTKKVGNCVDQTHLLIALMRASGIASRYVHGKATFTSGNTYGHVWAQVLIGDTWVVADTTSSKNSLGVVNNWKASTATIYGYYYSISF